MKRSISWKKDPAKRKKPRLGALTPEEQECVRVALRTLRVRFGSYAKVSAAMGVHKQNVARWAKSGSVTAEVAVAAARLAGASVDDVLHGKFPCPGSCPLCGRGPDFDG